MDMTKNIEGVQYFSPYDNRPMSWLDKVNLVWSITLVLGLMLTATFFMGASWMSDLDSYAAQTIAQ